MTFKNKIEQIILDVWFGREKLYKVFWIYKVLIGGFIGVLFQVLYLNKDFKTLSMGVLAFYLVYHVWVLKGLFTCKNNVEKFHFISDFVPYFIIVNAFALGFTIFNVFKSVL